MFRVGPLLPGRSAREHILHSPKWSEVPLDSTPLAEKGRDDTDALRTSAAPADVLPPQAGPSVTTTARRGERRRGGMGRATAVLPS